MDDVERLVRQFGKEGVETSFAVGDRSYRVFAYPSPGRGATCVRWNLYEADASGRRLVRGLTFGVSDGVRAAFEDVVQAARTHARTGAVSERAPRTFRPSPLD
jgi:hypothetical protein